MFTQSQRGSIRYQIENEKSNARPNEELKSIQYVTSCDHKKVKKSSNLDTKTTGPRMLDPRLEIIRLMPVCEDKNEDLSDSKGSN